MIAKSAFLGPIRAARLLTYGQLLDQPVCGQPNSHARSSAAARYLHRYARGFYPLPRRRRSYGRPGWAFGAEFELTSGLLTDHTKILKYQDRQAQPYPMSFTDEAARTLGVHNGRWEPFDTGRSRNALTPTRQVKNQLRCAV